MRRAGGLKGPEAMGVAGGWGQLASSSQCVGCVGVCFAFFIYIEIIHHTTYLLK